MCVGHQAGDHVGHVSRVLGLHGRRAEVPLLGDADALAHDVEYPAGHVLGCGAAQPRRGHGDPTGIHLLLGLLVHAGEPGQVLGHAGVGAGGQAVAGHAVLDQLHGRDEGERGDAGLGCAVVGLSDVAVDARRG